MEDVHTTMIFVLFCCSACGAESCRTAILLQVPTCGSIHCIIQSSCVRQAILLQGGWVFCFTISKGTDHAWVDLEHVSIKKCLLFFLLGASVFGWISAFCGSEGPLSRFACIWWESFVCVRNLPTQIALIASPSFDSRCQYFVSSCFVCTWLGLEPCDKSWPEVIMHKFVHKCSVGCVVPILVSAWSHGEIVIMGETEGKNKQKTSKTWHGLQIFASLTCFFGKAKNLIYSIVSCLSDTA